MQKDVFKNRHFALKFTVIVHRGKIFDRITGPPWPPAHIAYASASGPWAYALSELEALRAGSRWESAMGCGYATVLGADTLISENDHIGKMIDVKIIDHKIMS